jgi:acyl-CoA thioester hydrolase
MKPELPITYRGVVYPWHCDQIGHMNVMWYTGKFDEATWHLLNLVGCTPSYMTQNNRGMVAVEQYLTYKRELLAGNILHIRSGILEVKDKSIRFFHEMFNSETNELAATTTLTGIHLDTVLRKATSLPEYLSAKAREMIVSQSESA